MLQEGKNAPHFTLKDDSGQTVSLRDFKGQQVVLYFYPKDDTPGCTKEACGFRDAEKYISKKNAVVLGVSADSIESHGRFKKKFGLPFRLLSDPDKKMLETYGVWVEKKLYGRKYMGIERTTVIIDSEGKIKKIFPKVKVDGHIDDVLNSLE